MFGGGNNNAWGQNNQQQQQQQQPQQGGLFGGGAPAAGGFGSGGGFGAAPATPFGQPAQPQQNSIFGGSAAPATSTFGGFGASTAPRPAFGASAAPAFGAQPAQSGGLFGGGNNTSTFGAAPAASGGFGAPQQPAQSGGLFGGGGGGFGTNTGASTAGFGSPAGGGLFGAPKTGFGATSAAVPGEVPANGTASPPWSQTQEGGEPGGTKTNDYYQTITAMADYKYASLEELRLKDYEQNRKTPQQQQAGGFGASTSTFGGFGSTPQQQPAQGGGLFGGGNTSSFGAPKPAGGLFGSTASTTPAFGSAPAAGGGLFGSQPAGSGGFGAPAGGSTFGGFGAQQQQPAKPAFGGFGASPAPAAPAFGAPAPAAPQSTFGGFGQQPQQQQQQPAPQSTFGGFGSTPAPASGGLFGAPAAPASGGLFGAQPPKPAGTGLFGAPAPAPASGGLFGSQPASGGGLFGSNPAPAQQSGGLFGSAPTSTPSPFGAPQQPAQQQQQQPSMFGAPAGGGLFGAKPATPAPTGGLFGSQPAPAQNTGGMFGGGGGLFGSTNNNQQQQQQQPAQQSGGLFGAKPAGGLFGSTSGGGGMFGSQLGQSQQQQQQPQQNLMASIDQNPYGQNPLFDQSGPALPMVHEISSKKQPLVALSGRSRTPQSTKNLTRLRGFAASPSMPAFGSASPGGGSLNGSFNGRGSPARGNGLGGLSDDASVALSPHAFVSRNSVKKLVLDRRVDGSDVLNSSRSMGSPAPNTGGFLASGEKQKVTFDPRVGVQSMFNDTFSPARKPATPAPQFVDTPSKVPERAMAQTLSSGASTSAVSGFNASKRATDNQAAPAPKAAPQHGEYYTKPDMDTLVGYGYQDLTSLSSFVVGRVGFGEVTFLDPVDLTSVSSIREIPGNYVVFESKLCEVYPEEVPKAPPGTGLNVPSEITLIGCFPINKATREPIKDVDHPRMKSHERILRQKQDTEFVSYEPATGTWVFKVPHYTRYGFDEDDEEEEEEMVANQQQQRPQPAPTTSTTPRAPPPANARRVAQEPSASPSEEDEDDDEDAPPVTYGSDDDEEMMSTSQPRRRSPPRSTAAPRRGDIPRRRSDFRIPGRQSEDDLGMSDESMADIDADPNGGGEGEDDEGDSQDDEDEDEEERSEAEELEDDDEASEEDDRDREGSMHYSELDGNGVGASSRGPAASRPPPWGSVQGVQPRKVQVMQASFFRSSGQGDGGAKADERPTPRFLNGSASTARKAAPLAGMASVFGRQQAQEEDVAAEDAPMRPSFAIDDAPLSRPTRKYTRIAAEASLVKPSAEGIVADAGLMMGRSFRVGWGPDGTLVHMGKICGQKEASSPASGSSVKLDQIKLLTSDSVTESTRSRRLLNVQLAHTDIELDDGVPVATPRSSLRFTDFSTQFSADDQSPEAQLWRLGNALFDEIDLGLPPTASAELIHRVAPIRRKLALSKWLQSAVSPPVDHDLLNSQDAGPARVFTLLTGNQIALAAEAALDAGDLRLATLIARIGGNQQFRDDVFLQLEKWREHRVDAAISADYRKVYSLLAGIVDVSEGASRATPDTAPEVVIASGLDWKRAFGLHLWYGASFDSDLSDGLRRYSHALSTSHAPAPPMPWYVERPSLAKDLTRWAMPVAGAQDALFLLLSLAVDSATPLEAALDPSAFGPSPLDFRLPWHLYTVLSRAIGCRDFEDREAVVGVNGHGGEEDVEGYSNSANALTSSYAAQLEQLGLWDQAAFVLLHLELPESREKALKELLFRNVSSTSAEKDSFVIDTLLVPAEWIAEAKANTANDSNDPYTRYLHLLDAKLWDQAAHVAVRDLVPEAILREDFELVRELLEPLRNARVTDWNTGGQVALDLITTLTRLPLLLASTTSSSHTPDAAETDELARLSSNLPSLIRLLPGLFPDKSLQSSVVLSDTLARLLRFGGALAVGKWLDSAPTIPHGEHLLESEELSLVQASVLDKFSMSLEAYA